jgi:pimeloyl-ACP methyl ester carboxylesterase
MGGISAITFAAEYPGGARAIVAIDAAVTSSDRRNHYLRRLKVLPVIAYPDLETALARFRLMPKEGDIAPATLRTIAEKSLGRTSEELSTQGRVVKELEVLTPEQAAAREAERKKRAEAEKLAHTERALIKTVCEEGEIYERIVDLADAENLDGVEIIRAAAKPDLSVGAFPDIAKARYFEISI